ncbi:hypothetical protein KFE25_004167 [Diacronema lutheri]|uniref:Uncharacterized protein n=1 Tax=Diacronema lutheri TaxID=2081491 RepID=A0A8J5X3N2_DIALT|nr:hypothetical protein KFE25_004167 [Diacronema lutheri]
MAATGEWWRSVISLLKELDDEVAGAHERRAMSAARLSTSPGAASPVDEDGAAPARESSEPRGQRPPREALDALEDARRQSREAASLADRGPYARAFYAPSLYEPAPARARLVASDRAFGEAVRASTGDPLAACATARAALSGAARTAPRPRSAPPAIERRARRPRSALPASGERSSASGIRSARDISMAASRAQETNVAGSVGSSPTRQQALAGTLSGVGWSAGAGWPARARARVRRPHSASRATAAADRSVSPTAASADLRIEPSAHTASAISLRPLPPRALPAAAATTDPGERLDALKRTLRKISAKIADRSAANERLRAQLAQRDGRIAVLERAHKATHAQSGLVQALAAKLASAEAALADARTALAGAEARASRARDEAGRDARAHALDLQRQLARLKRELSEQFPERAHPFDSAQPDAAKRRAELERRWRAEHVRANDLQRALDETRARVAALEAQLGARARAGGGALARGAGREGARVRHGGEEAAAVPRDGPAPAPLPTPSRAPAGGAPAPAGPAARGFQGGAAAAAAAAPVAALEVRQRWVCVQPYGGAVLLGG